MKIATPTSVGNSSTTATTLINVVERTPEFVTASILYPVASTRSAARREDDATVNPAVIRIVGLVLPNEASLILANGVCALHHGLKASGFVVIREKHRIQLPLWSSRADSYLD
jgi:hypothetical protein